MLENRVYKRDTIDCYQSLHNKCVLLCVYVHFSPSPTVSNTTGPTHSSLLPIPTCPLPPSKLVSWISARSKFSGPRFIYSCLFFICIIPVMPVVLKLSVYRVINSITLQPPFYPPLHLLQWLPPPSVHCVCTCVGLYLPLFVCVCVSQWAEVMAGAGLLAENLAPPVAAHFSVPTPIPVSVATVWPRHQPGQEALGPAGQALPATWARVAVGPSWAHAVTPCRPDSGLQQLVGAVVQRGRELHVDAVKHHGAGLGLWWETGRYDSVCFV